jgi:hypothetical protein
VERKGEKEREREKRKTDIYLANTSLLFILTQESSWANSSLIICCLEKNQTKQNHKKHLSVNTEGPDI